MKRIALFLMFASITSMVMSANESQKRTEMVKPRGQPQLHAGYNVYVAPANFEIAELSVAVTSETYARVNPSTGIAAKKAVEGIVPVIVEGARKVRDVDSGSLSELYNKNTDKRNAIYNKTTRFTRSPASIRHV
jgi:hypothetical protein